jgi:hypothetical protein
MAHNRYESVIIADTLVGSYLNARFPLTNPAEVQMAYSGTAGSVVLLIDR